MATRSKAIGSSCGGGSNAEDAGRDLGAVRWASHFCWKGSLAVRNASLYVLPPVAYIVETRESANNSLVRATPFCLPFVPTRKISLSSHTTLRDCFSSVLS